MKFLEIAERYAADRGDETRFRQWYEHKREKYSVHESTWMALFAIYGAAIADDQELLAEAAE